MSTFSQRLGFEPIKTIVQKESIDDNLRTELWNYFVIELFDSPSQNWSSEKGYRRFILQDLWHQYFRKRIDEIPAPVHVTSLVKGEFFYGKWYCPYNIIEYIVKHPFVKNDNSDTFSKAINDILEKNLSAYRLVDGQFIEISTDEEVAAIKSALGLSDKYENVKSHLKASIKLLSNKPNPDFRNSIKESISAVEAICQIITAQKNATLGQALNILERNGTIHKALKSGFSNLYGFTSDAGGIRHALTENDEVVGQDEAIYFLVSCSAFINFIIKKTSK